MASICRQRNTPVSFALSILLGIVFFVSFCICVSLTLDAQQNASQGPVPGPELLLPVCFMMGALFASIVPLGLGIGGICEPNSRKLFSILGTVFSGILLLIGIAGLVCMIAFHG